MSALVSLTLAEGLQMITQVFGGCCLNVFILETMVAQAGPTKPSVLITFAQFLFIALMAYPSQTSSSSSWYTLWLKHPKIPIVCWFYYVLMFFSVSVLNNLALNYNISVPLHTIIRSSSIVITMMVGYIFGKKKYNVHQVVSAVLVTAGALLATVPPNFMDNLSLKSLMKIYFRVNPIYSLTVLNGYFFSSGGSTWSGALSHTYSYYVTNSSFVGLAILVLLSVISAFMSLYNEKLFRNYGNHWQECLFYTHFLGLPLFIAVAPSLKEQWVSFLTGPTIKVGSLDLQKNLINLALNVTSQYLCIRGVNMLAGKTSALTVSIVLLVRKFVSLAISVVWFGNDISAPGLAGAALVFLGAAYYGIS